MQDLPREAEVVVAGGGTAGPVVAARLAEAGRDVLLLEAGPDPGPLGDPRWPADLLDATRLGTSYDWGYDSGDTYPGRRVRFERARVLGGCSAHNGAVQTWGHRADYDGWAALGNPGWSADELAPLFARADEQQRVWTYTPGELTPYQRAWYDAAPAVGLPQLRHLNDLDETVGVAPESVNIVDGIRFNAAFAYLDPLRSRENLRIAGDALVDRVLVARGRVTGVAVVHRGQVTTVHAQTVVLCGGTYGSPAILLRSGVGPADALRRLGIDVVADVPGVGDNLHDQPFALLTWEGSEAIEREMDAAQAAGWTPDEQVMMKAATGGEAIFDLHLLPYSPTHLRGDGRRSWHAGASVLTPLSRGRLELTSRAPEAPPRIDHGFLTDPEGRDVARLAEGVEILREIAAQPSMRALLGREITPGPDADLPAHLRANIDNYWHPVGTCKMGPASDPDAVVDHRGEVRGVAGCHVADCAIMPSVPRATTHTPAVVVGERIARALLGA
jgi:choline dehydrogenase